jgi:hypothetical protein
MVRRSGGANLTFSMNLRRDKGEWHLSAWRTWARQKPGAAGSAQVSVETSRGEARVATVSVGTRTDAWGHFGRVGLVSGSKPRGRTV